ncbi:DUF2917 domain-containing protein [Burkholderia territorii]|uniref:DUF2917 domain-containing protein n=1 Tax=Burkholderia territorii TaxID=1503055 RepID=A0A6L3NAN1_9BURK|nr:DUF2917 domain-containing protein [Burkholderia territorii]KAB0656960.1 DUF2917 domain-containing protein [Burkholderia territorii]MBM2774357.1 DUF2917 domain-containing protein [Burkholderia territorii]VWB54523.1 hypothetical protein BTE28158_02503 [Burkholderia territorii]
MRELRLYEMDGNEPAGRWRIVDRTALHVAHGDLWVTIEGRPDDHWLRAGETLALLPGMRVWISAAAGGAVFAFGQQAAPAVRAAPIVWQRFAAWRGGHGQAAASLPT